MNNVLVYFHIPRTAGTFFSYAVGHHLTDWLTHYNWTENCSALNMQNNDVPLLKNRTNEQKNQIKVLSGHSVNAISHKLIGNVNPLFYTIIRDPIERLLSSYNFKRQKCIVLQDEEAWPILMPTSDIEVKHYNEYNTLFEYLDDFQIEQNLQSKWLVKSFYNYDVINHALEDHQDLDNMLMSQLITNNQHTCPLWLQGINLNTDIIDLCIEKMWYMSTMESLENDLQRICTHLDLTYVKNENKNASNRVTPRWTIDDVKQQPDYELLKNSLKLDYYLYNQAKNFERLL